MDETRAISLPPLGGWAVILGASSGFGAATARALARAGMDILGIHLDRRATLPNVRQVVTDIESVGRRAWFYNANAADAEARAEVLDDFERRLGEGGERSGGAPVRVLMHSLAFGTLLPFVPTEEGPELSERQMDMTLNVMANSLVFWTQALVKRALLGQGGRIFAMTSTGSTEVWPAYGAVSAAKAALEAHIRQLAHELAPRGITANAICAGVTDTPALEKIPGAAAIRDVALRKNPYGRLTTPEDIANAIAAFALPCTYWLTGNVLYVDGGEYHAG